MQHRIKSESVVVEFKDREVMIDGRKREQVSVYLNAGNSAPVVAWTEGEGLNSVAWTATASKVSAVGAPPSLEESTTRNLSETPAPAAPLPASAPAAPPATPTPKG